MSNPLIAFLYVINEGAVIMVFPAVRLTVIEYRSFTCTTAFPSADNVAAVIFVDPYESNGTLITDSLFTVTDMSNRHIGRKLIITDIGDDIFTHDRYALTGIVGECNYVSVN